jgi:hypothetical protein
VDVAYGGEEGRGREDSDAGDGEEILDRRDGVTEPLELVFECGGLGLELLDFLEGLKEGIPEKSGDQVMVEGRVGVDQERSGALGNGDAKFDEETADGVDAGRAAGEISGAKTVQGRDGLLIERFDRDGYDVLVACGFQDGSGIGPVGLVSDSVASNVRSREQGNLMAEGLDLAPPVVSRAACLHEHVAWGPVKEETPEPSA